jgi:hypothetical protein
MAEVYLIALIALLAAVIVHGLASPVRFYEYPWFMTVVFATFIAPQAISLYRFPAIASPSAVEAALLMSLLCALACVIGYRAPPNQWIVGHAQVAINDNRLFHVGILFLLCQIVFNYLISRMSDADRGSSMWTGRVTIYLFFASLGYPGFAICLSRALTRHDAASWFWTVIGSITPVVAGVFYGRRETTALFLLTVALTLYFRRRYVFPRIVVGGAIVVAMLAIPATAQYRSATTSHGLSRVTAIDFVGNFQRYLDHPVDLELRNAAMMIEATSHAGEYGLGRAYWDQLVFRFVPAQIVGLQTKEALMFRSSDEWLRHEFAARGYRAIVGATSTGMGDPYVEFGYFGALFFAVLAVVFKSLWAASLPRDSEFAQLLYIQTSTSAMRAITHQTSDYLPGLAYNLIFLGLAALYSRRPRTQGLASQSASVVPVSHAHP